MELAEYDGSQSSHRRRPLSPSNTAIEPAHKLHSGLFRDRTVQSVAFVAERLRSLQDPEPGAVMELLDELADYVIDERVLDKTKVGKDVAALQKSADADVAEKARALVAQWKKDRDIRNKVIKSFVDKAQLPMRDARKLEEGLFNFACPLGYLAGDGFRSYQRNFLRLSTHLRTEGPGSLMQRFKEGQLCLEEVAFLPDEQLLSIAQQEKLLADKQAGLQEALATTGAEPTGTISNEYMCPRCQGNHTMYKDVQTGWHNDQQDVTILVQCLDCGERWKANDDHGLGGS